MADLPTLLAIANCLKLNLDELLLRAKVQDSGEARVAITLCLTISEQYAAALHMIEGGFSSHAPTLVRSMLEGQAAVFNLVADPAYLDQMRFDNARADVTLFTEYVADPGMQDDPDALERLAAFKAQAEPVRDELKAKGYKKQDVIEKFRAAKILPAYVAYRVFCSFAHNQLTTLLSRHAGNFSLRYHYEAPPELTAGVLGIAVGILCQSVMAAASKYTDLTEVELHQVMDPIDEAWTAATK